MCFSICIWEIFKNLPNDKMTVPQIILSCDIEDRTMKIFICGKYSSEKSNKRKIYIYWGRGILLIF